MTPAVIRRAREWVRWWVGYVLATPFYACAGLGERAERVGQRIVTWSEQASSSEGATSGPSDPTVWRTVNINPYAASGTGAAKCDGSYRCPAGRHIEGCFTGEGHPDARPPERALHPPQPGNDYIPRPAPKRCQICGDARHGCDPPKRRFTMTIKVDGDSTSDLSKRLDNIDTVLWEAVDQPRHIISGGGWVLTIVEHSDGLTGDEYDDALQRWWMAKRGG